MLVFVVASALPAATTKTSTAYATSANLYLRTGASTRHRAIVLLKKGTKLTVRATKGSWYQVTANGRTGWVARSYVTKTIAKVVVPQPTAPTTAKNVKHTTTANLLLRRSAPTGAAITTLRKGSTVITTGAARKVSGTTWYQVKYGSLTGWSASAYLKMAPAAKPVAQSVAKPVAKAPTAPKIVSGKPGKFTTTANVYLRVSAPAGRVLTLMSKGTAVAATGKTVNHGTTVWRQVKVGTATGWTSGSYLAAYVAPPAVARPVAPPVVAPAPAPADPPGVEHVDVPATFAISGAGWGHGVGMSQYGAQGMAKAGSGAAAILEHYYAPARTATTTALASSDIRVQLLSTTASTITPSGGRLRILDGSARLATTSSPVSLKLVNGKVVATMGSETHTVDGALTVQWEGTRHWPGAVVGTVSVPNANGGSAAGTYRHGQIEVSVLGGKLNLVNQLRMNDEYLYGLAEMPSSWEPAALQAQAIAGRTYAMRNMATLKSACGCNVYDEVASQKFTGWGKENEGGGVSGAKWKAAVDATQTKASGIPTSATVVKYNGYLIDAVYFSSSGGMTRTAQSVWGNPHAYLQSRGDAYSVSPLSGNPNRAWAYTATQSKMATAFGIGDIVSVSVAKNADLTVSSATATAANGETRTITGAKFRASLPTKSAWITGVSAP